MSAGQQENAGRWIHFPAGLPAFEHTRGYWLKPAPGAEPLVLLECADAPAPRFVCAPVALLWPDYRLQLSQEEEALLELHAENESTLDVYAILTLPGQGTPTANLLAPVVVHRAAGIGLQPVQCGTDYPLQMPLPRFSSPEGS